MQKLIYVTGKTMTVKSCFKCGKNK